MAKYICDVCGYEYDPAAGDPENGIEPGTKKYDIILKGNIEKGLCAAFGIESIYQADLAACAEKYLRGIGVEEETIRTLKEKLGKSYGD